MLYLHRLYLFDIKHPEIFFCHYFYYFFIMLIFPFFNVC